MLLSIVIPVYNTKEYLEKCVASVYIGDSEDYEIILVDDGSTDGESPALCDELAVKYSGNVKVIHHENKGLGGARNTGIETSCGEYILFVDSDDRLKSDAVKLLIDKIKETESDIVSFNFYTDNGEGKIEFFQSNYFESDEAFLAVEHPEILLSMPSAWSRVWKKTLFTENDIRYPDRAWYEDIRTTLKLFVCAEKIITVKEAFYYYLRREGSIMNSKNIERNREIIDAFDDIISWFKSENLFSRYNNELEKCCIDNLFVAASVRVLMADTKHYLLSDFRKFLIDNFPDYKNNPYIKCLPFAKKVVYKLLLLKQYSLIKLLFKIKGN